MTTKTLPVQAGIPVVPDKVVGVIADKTYDKKDRAVAAARKTLGGDAVLNEDFELKRLENKRWYWSPLKVDQPKAGDRVYLVDGPQVVGKVVVAGAAVCEVKWDSESKKGRISNELTAFLRVVSPSVSTPEQEGAVDDIPEFLKAKNRQSLTPEKKAELDAHLKSLAWVLPEEKKQDTRIPKNIEPAGLELLKQQKGGAKPQAKAGTALEERPTGKTGSAVQTAPSAPAKSGEGAPLKLRDSCELYNSLVEKVGLKPRKINTTGFSGKPDAVRALKKLEQSLIEFNMEVPAELSKYLEAWAK